MSRYGVINMDIVNSRGLSQRSELLFELKSYFNELENSYNNLFVAPITMTLGDEWQIVVRDIKEVYNIYCKIKFFLSLKGIEVYGGIGIGTITTDISKDTREMDGTSFVNAREAINIAKENKNFYSKKLYTKDCKVVLIGKNDGFDITKNQVISEVAITREQEESYSTYDIINTLIQNNEMIENKYTEKQKEIIYLYEKYESYSELEKHFNLDKSGISRKLTTSNYFLSIHNKNLITLLLEGLYKERGYGV